MSRKQRIRVCNNLLELATKTKSRRAFQLYLERLETTASRLKQKEQPQRATA